MTRFVNAAARGPRRRPRRRPRARPELRRRRSRRRDPGRPRAPRHRRGRGGGARRARDEPRRPRLRAGACARSGSTRRDAPRARGGRAVRGRPARAARRGGLDRVGPPRRGRRRALPPKPRSRCRSATGARSPWASPGPGSPRRTPRSSGRERGTSGSPCAPALASRSAPSMLRARRAARRGAAAASATTSASPTRVLRRRPHPLGRPARRRRRARPLPRDPPRGRRRGRAPRGIALGAQLQVPLRDAPRPRPDRRRRRAVVERAARRLDGGAGPGRLPDRLARGAAPLDGAVPLGRRPAAPSPPSTWIASSSRRDVLFLSLGDPDPYGALLRRLDGRPRRSGGRARSLVRIDGLAARRRPRRGARGRSSPGSARGSRCSRTSTGGGTKEYWLATAATAIAAPPGVAALRERRLDLAALPAGRARAARGRLRGGEGAAPTRARPSRSSATTPSPEAREAIDAVLDDVFGRLVADVAAARRLPRGAGPRARGPGALRRRGGAGGAGLLDEVLWPDELEALGAARGRAARAARARATAPSRSARAQRWGPAAGRRGRPRGGGDRRRQEPRRAPGRRGGRRRRDDRGAASGARPRTAT